MRRRFGQDSALGRSPRSPSRLFCLPATWCIPVQRLSRFGHSLQRLSPRLPLSASPPSRRGSSRSAPFERQLTISIEMEWPVLRQGTPQFARPCSTARSPSKTHMSTPLKKISAHRLRSHRRPPSYHSVLYMRPC